MPSPTGSPTTQVVDPTSSQLQVVDPASSRRWADLVQATDSVLFHSPPWIRVLQATYGGELSACVVERGGKPVAGVPWYEADDILGRRRVSLAFSDFSDILGPDPADRKRVAEFVGGAGVPWLLRSRGANLPDVGFPVSHSTLFKWQVIDERADEEELWGRTSSSSRWGVRKAERMGVEVRKAANKDELRTWFLLHRRTRKAKHGLLVQPYAFFENIWDTFMARDQGYLLLAIANGRVIGGNLYLLWKDTCYYKFSASEASALAWQPNNLLMWRGMLEARERGCRWLDLGRSNAKQEGLIAFKRGFGAQQADLHALTYQTGREDSLPQQELRGLLQSLTRILVQDQVPDDVTEQAGAMLYRFFT